LKNNFFAVRGEQTHAHCGCHDAANSQGEANQYGNDEGNDYGVCASRPEPSRTPGVLLFDASNSSLEIVFIVASKIVTSLSPRIEWAESQRRISAHSRLPGKKSFYFLPLESTFMLEKSATPQKENVERKSSSEKCMKKQTGTRTAVPHARCDCAEKMRLLSDGKRGANASLFLFDANSLRHRRPGFAGHRVEKLTPAASGWFISKLASFHCSS
jgi:hypothetical protein